MIELSPKAASPMDAANVDTPQEARLSGDPTIVRLEGESLEFHDDEAYLTLRLDGAAARWFADHLPLYDEATKTFAYIAAKLESVDCVTAPDSTNHRSQE